MNRSRREGALGGKIVPNFTSTCLWPSIWQVAEGRGPPLPLCPSALQSTCPMNSSELAPAFPDGSPSQRSPQGQVLTGIFERCRNFFPAFGRNQTLLKLVVLPSAEFSSGISQQRNLLPHPMFLSNLDCVPSPRS